MELKRASFFDIDGTLMSGLVIVSFPYFLEKRRLFETGVLKEYDCLMKDYADKKITYRTIGLKIPTIYSRGVKGQHEKDVKSASVDFLEEQKRNIYPFSKGLINVVKKIGPAIAITGSPIEPISALNKEYGFDEICATEFETKNGIYTGNVLKNMIIKETKEKTIKDIAEKNNFDLKQCFGFGDTEQDTAILNNVGYPVAINPNTELAKTCTDRNWPKYSKLDDVKSAIEKIIKTGVKSWN